MAGTNGTTTAPVEGLVEVTNANGIKVNGHWLNRSAFGAALELPAKGAYIRAQVDARGYLKSIETVEHTPATASLSHASERDERITRLAVLKAAANFVGLLSQTREDVKSEHVLRLADKWVEWVNEL